jgi:hypothetical protein
LLPPPPSPTGVLNLVSTEVYTIIGQKVLVVKNCLRTSHLILPQRRNKLKRFY